jgi:hypothetical protein
MEDVETSGDCPQEDLAKSGYKSQLNYKSLFILLISLATQRKSHINIWQFLPFVFLFPLKFCDVMELAIIHMPI